MKTRTKLLSAGAAVALTAGISAGIAAADPPTPSPSSSPSAAPSGNANPSAKPERQGRNAPRAVLRRAIHGEVTLGGRQHRVVDFQRGTVDKVSATSITVTSADGFSATYTIGSATVVRKDKAKAAVSDLQVQDKVGVIATKEGPGATARLIADRG